MGRLFLFLLSAFVVFSFINAMYGIFKKESESGIPSLGEKSDTKKKDSEYWYYTKPHYHIMSNGEKFNIPDYVSWDDWKGLSKENRIRLCLQIENRILSTSKNIKEDNNSIEISK